jgi:aldehyde:ferredoxin oxidoreductase
MTALRYGWTGKILRIDLTRKDISEVPTDRYAPEWIGGRAMGARIYWDEVPPEVSAYDPENRLIFTTGPAVGTMAPSANRVFVTGKSPIPYPVECYFFSSMGGHWGPELKFAGYDGLTIQGKAAQPVYLWINDGQTEIRDATPLWGMTSRAAQLAMKEIHGDRTRSLVIGPAGENRCREAIISCDTAFAAGQGWAPRTSRRSLSVAQAASGSQGLPNYFNCTTIMHDWRPANPVREGSPLSTT